MKVAQSGRLEKSSPIDVPPTFQLLRRRARTGATEAATRSAVAAAAEADARRVEHGVADRAGSSLAGSPAPPAAFRDDLS
jgi:hypothetical protein